LLRIFHEHYQFSASMSSSIEGFYGWEFDETGMKFTFAPRARMRNYGLPSGAFGARPGRAEFQ
ncbi:MAG: hypothetical protein ACRD4Y_14240, partial [Candidatus Acidiferrales bacterium]